MGQKVNPHGLRVGVIKDSKDFPFLPGDFFLSVIVGNRAPCYASYSLPASLNNTRPAAQRDTERRNRSNHIYQYRLHDTRPYFPAQHTAAGAAPPYN